MSIESRMSLRQLVGGLAGDADSLVRGEIALARAELDQKMNRVIAGLISLVGAMLLAYAGLIIVLLAAAAGLAHVMPIWAANLIVGCIVLAIGVVLALSAKKALEPSGMIPERTANNLEADAQVVKEHAT